MTMLVGRYAGADSVLIEINTKKDELEFSASALSSQIHEQLGRRYLFEIKLDQMLRAGHDVDVEEAAGFLSGIQPKLKYLPEGIQEKLGKLAQVPSVYAVLTKGVPATGISTPRPFGM